MAVAVINPRFIRVAVKNFVVMHINVGVHNGNTAVADFYAGPVKKLMQFVMRRKMLI